MDNKKLNLSQIYDKEFMSQAVFLFDFPSGVTIVLTTILIIIIITKSPKQMSSFKPYLLSYSCINLLLAVCCALYCPTIVHPYFGFYPLGYIKALNPNISFIFLGFILAFFCALLDSSAAMSLERFYAMRNLSSSKIPTRIYGFLLFCDALFMFGIFVAAFCPTIFNSFLLSESQIAIFAEQNFVDFGVLDFRFLIIFQNPVPNSAPMHLLIFATFFFLHVLFPCILLIMNYLYFKKQQSSQSYKLRNINQMLLRTTMFQFCGWIFFVLTSCSSLFLNILFFKEPNNFISYAIAFMNLFCFYDTFITIFFIEPYRKFFTNVVKKLLPKSVKIQHRIMEYQKENTGAGVSVIKVPTTTKIL